MNFAAQFAIEMAVNTEVYNQLKRGLDAKGVTLVAVSKTKPAAEILELYQLGQRDFGENYVQEMVQKAEILPKDIRWHFIGHLQSNKVKLIVPFVQLIHGVDSLKLLKEISKEATKAGRIVNCLLQVHIAREETKFGLSEEELQALISEWKNTSDQHARICGLMGMASFTTDIETVRSEFRRLKTIFDEYRSTVTDEAAATLSMGMSADYAIAIEEGSNMVRIGSLIFGERIKT